MDRSFIYFVGDESHIRIGITFGDPTRRINQHKRYGLQLLAVLPGSDRNERDLHAFFRRSLVPDRDSSTYERKVIDPYISRLLEYRYATGDLKKAATWSSMDFRFWHPERLTKPIEFNGQGTLFVTGAMLADERDCYETPEHVLEPCRRALGGRIDLDPCSNSVANERVRAEHFYDVERDGLSVPWFGSVFVNPPYGGNKEPGAARFMQKLCHEISENRIDSAITVLNLQSWPTKWFPLVWQHARAHAVWASRIDFIRPRTKTGSKPYSSSKNGTIFSYFGKDIERFKKAFENQASVFQPIPSDAHQTSWMEMWSKPFDFSREPKT